MINDIITPNRIEEILTRYNIGKKPLAKLLGWGETTVIRFINGDRPSNEYSDRLIELENPLAYMGLLQRNHNNITDIAYRKSLEAAKKEQEYYIKNKMKFSKKDITISSRTPLSEYTTSELKNELERRKKQ